MTHRHEEFLPPSASSILEFTNAARRQHGQPPLSRSAQLDRAAEQRLTSMLEGGYFAHVSPQGEGPEEAARAAGYEFLIVGENLASGAFEEAGELVAQWMASSGHRKNILGAHYKELGLAISTRTGPAGPETIAVQIFGTPSAACPQPDRRLAENIDSSKQNLAALEKQISLLADGDGAELNKLIVRYNSAAAEVNKKVHKYNEIVQHQRACFEKLRIQAES